MVVVQSLSLCLLVYVVTLTVHIHILIWSYGGNDAIRSVLAFGLRKSVSWQERTVEKSPLPHRYVSPSVNAGCGRFVRERRCSTVSR
jgi:hypothetical protein